MYSVGIDLGTTYSCVAYMHKGEVEIVPDNQGARITPSYVAFTESEDPLIGSAAVLHGTRDPKNTVYDAKRLIGRSFSDGEVQSDMKIWPFDVDRDKNNRPLIGVMYRKSRVSFPPDEISGYVLMAMKKIAQDNIGDGHTVNKVVVTVPAHFNPLQRRETCTAANNAGLFVLEMINEPTAAALAYGLQEEATTPRNVLVYDLGGGTFDVTVLTIDDGMFEVKASGGDSHLGGQDFTEKLYRELVRVFKKTNKLDMTSDANARRKLFSECERVKKLLSAEERVEAYVENLFGGRDFTAPVTRAKFEYFNKNLFTQTIGTVGKVLFEAGMKKKEIDDVVLVGGSTRIPYVRTMLEKYFGKEKIRMSINPDEAVAYGAAVHAAIQSGDVSGELKKMKVRDVNPTSLGVEDAEFKMDFVVERNTPIPTETTRIYATSKDNQTTLAFKIFEGERPLTKDNRLFGCFNLTELPKLPAREAKAKVTFNIDENGMLHITAVDLSRPENKISIHNTWDKPTRNVEEAAKPVDKSEIFTETGRNTPPTSPAKMSNPKDDLKQYARKARIMGERNRGTKEQRDNLFKQAQGVLDWLETAQHPKPSDIQQKRSQLEKAFAPILSSKN